MTQDLLPANPTTSPSFATNVSFVHGFDPLSRCRPRQQGPADLVSGGTDATKVPKRKGLFATNRHTMQRLRAAHTSPGVRKAVTRLLRRSCCYESQPRPSDALGDKTIRRRFASVIETPSRALSKGCYCVALRSWEGTGSWVGAIIGFLATSKHVMIRVSATARKSTSRLCC